jgi:WAS/WASL-interacting protein
VSKQDASGPFSIGDDDDYDDDDDGDDDANMDGSNDDDGDDWDFARPPSSSRAPQPTSSSAKPSASSSSLPGRIRKAAPAAATSTSFSASTAGPLSSPHPDADDDLTSPTSSSSSSGVGQEAAVSASSLLPSEPGKRRATADLYMITPHDDLQGDEGSEMRRVFGSARASSIGSEGALPRDEAALMETQRLALAQSSLHPHEDDPSLPSSSSHVRALVFESADACARLVVDLEQTLPGVLAVDIQPNSPKIGTLTPLSCVHFLFSFHSFHVLTLF